MSVLAERFNNTGRNARAYTGPTYHKLNDRMLELTKHTKDLAMDNWRLSRRMFALEQQMLRLSNSTSEDPGDDTFLSPPRERSTTSAYLDSVLEPTWFWYLDTLRINSISEL